ncbi:MAG TPA: MCE family protein [Mycobacteriales bacterium]|nr:MCE family protein [Mycobacteriales bacterium]
MSRASRWLPDRLRRPLPDRLRRSLPNRPGRRRPGPLPDRPADRRPRRLPGWLPPVTLLSRSTRALLIVFLLVAGFAAGSAVLGGGARVHITAHFSRAVGVYPGSDVRVLGVKIGTITEVVPEGATVRVRMSYDADQPVPADAIAVIIPPSVVSDRYVQLAPVYRAGPMLADGADIPLRRTASPVELDDIYAALNDLSVALGPKGANAGGALSTVVDVAAANLAGNGAALGQSLADFSRAVQTLGDGRQDLVGVLRDLATFTRALASNDQQVRQFNQLLSSVAGQLAGERTELAAALSNLASALGQVSAFVRENRNQLHADISGLALVAGVLAKQRAALAEVLDTAPLALGNIGNAYNASSGTLDTRDQLGSLADPAVLCGLLDAAGKLPALDPVKLQLCQALAGKLATLPTIPGTAPPPGTPGTGPGLPSIPGLPPLPLPSLPIPVPTLPSLPLPSLPLPSLPIGGGP